jgi:hypothetical protein
MSENLFLFLMDLDIQILARQLFSISTLKILHVLPLTSIVSVVNLGFFCVPPLKVICYGLETWLQWWSSCPASAKPRVQFLVPPKKRGRKVIHLGLKVWL